MPKAFFPRPVHPDRIAFGGNRVRVGPKVYALLKLLRSAGDSVTWRRIGREVFGGPIRERGKLDVLVHRANEKLTDIGCPLRLAVDSERVVVLS